MGMLLELFGEDAYKASLPEIKSLIMTAPPVSREKRSYMLKEYARVNNIKLTSQDFKDVEA